MRSNARASGLARVPPYGVLNMEAKLHRAYVVPSTPVVVPKPEPAPTPAPPEASPSEFNQSPGWFAFWVFLVPLVLVVGVAMTGVLR